MDEFIEKLSNAESVLFITGAGVSKASGIPTYRGAGGIYNNFLIPPEILMSSFVFNYFPWLTWNVFKKAYEAYKDVSPNDAHEVIALMELFIDKVHVITQNVDGLHVACGNVSVAEMHGTFKTFKCTKCNKVYNEYRGSHCECGSYLKPDVVLFGDLLPEKAVNKYHEILESKPDVVVVCGTTANFEYIVRPAREAFDDGRFVVVIDPVFPTNLRGCVNSWIKEPCEKVLPEVLNNLKFKN